MMMLLVQAPVDKHEQLSELLTSYTLHGLPKMPDSLTRGRPHYDQSAFTLERHWTDIVANHDRLNKRQRDQQEAVWELLSTEVEYLRKLRVIIDVSIQSQSLRHLSALHCKKYPYIRTFVSVNRRNNDATANIANVGPSWRHFTSING